MFVVNTHIYWRTFNAWTVGGWPERPRLRFHIFERRYLKLLAFACYDIGLLAEDGVIASSDLSI